MARDDDEKRGRQVPKGRLSRLARFGGLGAGIAGSAAAEGARRLSRGERPAMQELLLTPSNAKRLADQLSELRGAAMKLGQLLSMDGGDFLPPELAEILSKLRSQAHAMPPRQLRAVLAKSWGRDWPARFEKFDTEPIAAASIGQVHRALTKDGRDLAVKIQYPGVRESIGADVDNVATLVRMSGLLPRGVDISPLLDEAKRQLQDEADYEREAAETRRFAALLADREEFVVPKIEDDLTTKDVLAMRYLPGAPVETTVSLPQDERDRIATLLMGLVLDELFSFGAMQTDPNFANYLYQADSGRIALLDFGAARSVPAVLQKGYRGLLRAGLAEDWDEVAKVAERMGLVGEELDEDLALLMRDLLTMAVEPMKTPGPYDFGRTDLALRMRDKGLALRGGGFTHIPPPEAIFLHRKFGGTYLLATRLRAQVDVSALLAPHLRT